MKRWVIAAFLLAGCTAATTQTGLSASGQALIGVGNTFVAVGSAYSSQCAPAPSNVQMQKFCAGFKDFAPKFQTSYPQAVSAWNIARNANDASKANEATAVVLQLSAELTALALQVMAAQGVK